jgi:peptidoglycan hydrolase CwlO-like protein
MTARPSTSASRPPAVRPADGGPATARLAAAVQTLAVAQLAGPDCGGVTAGDELAAVRTLGAAPAAEPWDRGLLLGLRSRRQEVVDATVETAVARLARLAEPEAQDGFMSDLLDACFLNLPGVRRSAPQDRDGEARRMALLERAGSRLLAAVGVRLEQRAPGLEHHRARLLASARKLKGLAGHGFLADAVVELESALGTGERSDDLVAAELAQRRKLALYTSPLTADTTLLAYLARDRRMPLAEVSQELLQAYRILLAMQSKERGRRAILRAMDNLCHWLDATPQAPQAREETLPEVLARARPGVPRDQLDPRIGRHLEAHLELLPGPDHPEDLLRQLLTRYDSAEGEDILVRGLDLLRRLPLVRLRAEELCVFILSPARRQRSAAVWEALLRLVESLTTGLSDLVLTREPLERRQERRLRLLRALLAHDRRLRELLHRLATDRAHDLSRDAAVDAMVRETAWRILLRCLPQDRVALQREGLLEHQGRFFFATLAEAGKAHRRELWEVLLAHWEVLSGAGLAAAERRARVRAVADFFRRTREYAAVQEGATALGPMLRLAFDDGDAEVRELAEAALVEVGFALEVQRERDRRQLLALRDLLTASNAQVIALEAEAARLGGEAVAARAVRVEHALAVQELLQARECELTSGWISTAGLQVDLEEVRVELVEAIAAAERELVLLHELASRMRAEDAQASQVHAAIESLVARQAQQEEEVRRLHGERANAAGALARAESEVSDLRGRQASLARNPPAPPADTGDAARNAALAEDFQGRLARHRSDLDHLSSRIASASGDVQSCRHQIASCEQRIATGEREVRRLQAEIERLQGRIADLRRRIQELARELTSRQATLQAIRGEIERLEARARELAARQAAHQQQVRSALAANTRQLDERQGALRGVQAQLAALSAELNRTGHQRDRQQTESQRLVQAIDSGRESYDRTAARAQPESARADATGHAQREAYERVLTSAQEGLVQYVEGIQHAVGREEPLAARGGRRRRPAPPAPPGTAAGETR